MGNNLRTSFMEYGWPLSISLKGSRKIVTCHLIIIKNVIKHKIVNKSNFMKGEVVLYK